MKIFAKHLSFESLLDYTEGRLVETQRTATEAHLENCDECRTTLASVQRMVAALQGDELESAPPQSIALALKLFRPLTKAQAAEPQRRSLLGVLRFDSGLTAATGARSGAGAPLPARQLLFNLEDYDLDLRLEASGAAWLLAGQLLGSETTGTAALIGAGQHYRSELNELGEFNFAAVQPGLYQLVIALPAADLSIEDLRVGE